MIYFNLFVVIIVEKHIFHLFLGVFTRSGFFVRQPMSRCCVFYANLNHCSKNKVEMIIELSKDTISEKKFTKLH